MYLKEWCENESTGVGERILKGWDYEKNKELDINKLKTGSSKYAWFCCENGHEWKAQLRNITSGSWCNKCSCRGTSYTEQLIYVWACLQFNHVYNKTKLVGEEVDVYIEDLHLAIEYQSSSYHKDIVNKHDLVKLERLLAAGYQVLWITEWISLKKEVQTLYRDTKYKYRDGNHIISVLSNYLNQIYHLKTSDLLTDTMKRQAQISSTKVKYEDSLEYWLSHSEDKTFAEKVLKSLDKEKNMNLKDIYRGTTRVKIFMKCCDCGYEWITTPNHLTSDKHFCHRCANKSRKNKLITPSTYGESFEYWLNDTKNKRKAERIKTCFDDTCGVELNKIKPKSCAVKIKMLCPICKETWEVTPASLTSGSFNRKHKKCLEKRKGD